MTSRLKTTLPVQLHAHWKTHANDRTSERR